MDSHWHCKNLNKRARTSTKSCPGWINRRRCSWDKFEMYKENQEQKQRIVSRIMYNRSNMRWSGQEAEVAVAGELILAASSKCQW